MSAHTIHPDSHTHGLADDCPRCAEHAKQLYTLDNDNLRALYERRVVVEAGGAMYYRSGAEADAAYNLGIALRVVFRLSDMGALG